MTTPESQMDEREIEGSEPVAQAVSPEAQKPEVVMEAEKQVVEPEIDWKERYVRLAADYENHKKRSRRERDESRRAERAYVLKPWLEVFDSFARALEAAPAEDDSPYLTGMRAIARQMESTLARLDVAPMKALGEAFDPRYHEALATIPAEAGQESGTVTFVDQAGFVFSDGEVLRPARVVVAKG